jgi:hypothetical protein
VPVGFCHSRLLQEHTILHENVNAMEQFTQCIFNVFSMATTVAIMMMHDMR